MRPVAVVCSFALALAACGGSGPDSLASLATDSPSAPSTVAVSPTSAPPPEADDELSAPSASTSDTVSTLVDVPPPGCVVLSDFSTDAGQSEWQIVNDDVMGGRSAGDRRFDDGAMLFEGAIDTNGGGFSSLRRPIEVGLLSDMASILVSAESDQRTYMVTVEDQRPGRDRRVSHRAPLDFGSDQAFGVARVALADFSPSVFGQPIDDEPIEAGLVDEVGLMLSDGIDGPFMLRVRWIAACP